MGTNLPNGLKEKLVAEGRWGDFVRRRSDFRAGGMKPVEARKAAIEEFAPEFNGRVKLGKGRPRKADVEAAKGDVKDGVKKGVKGGVKGCATVGGGVGCTETGQKRLSTASEGVKREKIRVEAADAPEGDFGALEKRVCSDSTSFRWAFIHSQLRDGKVEDAPSAFAWTIYLLFLESPSAKVDLSRTILTKLIGKEDDSSGKEEDVMDGQAEYDIMKNLLEDRR